MLVLNNPPIFEYDVNDIELYLKLICDFGNLTCESLLLPKIYDIENNIPLKIDI